LKDLPPAHEAKKLDEFAGESGRTREKISSDRSIAPEGQRDECPIRAGTTSLNKCNWPEIYVPSTRKKIYINERKSAHSKGDDCLDE
jgi:hypothetical protein